MYKGASRWLQTQARTAALRSEGDSSFAKRADPRPPHRDWLRNQCHNRRAVQGRIVRIETYGAFVDLGKQVTGLIHISEVSTAFVTDIREHLTIGQSVTVRVTRVEGKRVSLSLRDVPVEIAGEKRSPKKRRKRRHGSGP